MKGKHGSVFLLLASGIIAGSMDLAIVGPSLPGMVKEFGLQPRSLSWVFTIYALFNLISLPMMTGLADRFGNQNVLRISIALLTISSVLTAISSSFWMVLASRALTGLSVSGIFPLAPAIVPDHFKRESRGRALGLIGASFGVSLMTGPLMSGFLLDWFGWRSLYLLVAGLGLISSFIGMAFPQKTLTRKAIRIPWPSLLLLMVSTGSFALLLSRTGWESSGWTRWLPYAFGMVGIISSFAFLNTERKSEQKLFPRGITHNPTARLILTLGVGTGIIQACYIFLPHYLVEGFSISDSRASFLLLPLVTAFTIGNYGFGRLTDHIGPIRVLFTGWVLLGLAFGLIGWTTGINYYLLASLLFGFGLATLESPSLRYLLIHIRLDGFATRAQGLLSIFVSLGQLSGSALLGSLAEDELTGDYRGAYRWIMLIIVLAIVLIWRLSVVIRSRERTMEEEM